MKLYEFKANCRVCGNEFSWTRRSPRGRKRISCDSCRNINPNINYIIREAFRGKVVTKEEK